MSSNNFGVDFGGVTESKVPESADSENTKVKFHVSPQRGGRMKTHEMKLASRGQLVTRRAMLRRLLDGYRAALPMSEGVDRARVEAEVTELDSALRAPRG